MARSRRDVVTLTLAALLVQSVGCLSEGSASRDFAAASPMSSADSAGGSAGTNQAANAAGTAGGATTPGNGGASGGGVSSASGNTGSPRAGAGGATIVAEDPSRFGPAGSAITRHGQLQAMGRRIVGFDGQPAQLKGMSLYWSDVDEGARYFDADTVKWLAQDWKVSVVRATIGVRDGFPGYLEEPERQLALLDAVIEGAVASGIYVLVDWHDHHADQHLEQAKDFFGKVAEKHGRKPNVLYEIWNEPRGEGEGKAGWAEIKPYAQEISAVLRQRGANGLMIVGTPYWDQRPDEVIGNEVQDENVAYTLHFYAGNNAHFLDNIGGGEIGRRAQAALAASLPLFVTEFGTTSHDNTSFNEAETRKWLAFLDQNFISYCNWSITAVEEGSAAVRPSASPEGHWSESQLTQSGRFVRSVLRGM